MENKEKFKSIPAKFVYCIHPDCPFSEQCLRHQAIAHINPSRRHVTIVNPTSVIGDQCQEFLPDVPQTVAYGTGKLYANLPHEKAIAIKKQLLQHLGRNEYYRKYRKVKPFMPDEMEYVRQLFLSHGLTSEPEYESYGSIYVWT